MGLLLVGHVSMIGKVDYLLTSVSDKYVGVCKISHSISRFLRLFFLDKMDESNMSKPCS